MEVKHEDTGGEDMQAGMQDAMQDGDVVQVIMQEDGQIVMPEGQFIQVNTDDGQTQFIQVTGEDGENQLIQLTPDGQAQIIQVTNSQGEPQLIQLATPGGFDGEQVATLQTEDDEVDQGAVVTEGIQFVQVQGGQTQMSIADSRGTKYILQQSESEEQEQIEEDKVQEEQRHLAHPEVEESSPIPQGGGEENNTSDKDQERPEEEVKSGVNEEGSETVEVNENLEEVKSSEANSVPKPGPIKTVDLEKPIQLTSETVVTVEGRKCVLRVDPATNHLVAYPCKSGGTGRKRGRPRKIPSAGAPVNTLRSLAQVQAALPGLVTPQKIKTEPAETPTPTRGLSEQENSAAEGLLGLSDADGVRRSNRKKKKAKTLADYETGAIEGVEEDEVDESEDGDGEPVKRGRGRPPKVATPQPQVSGVVSATKNTMHSLLASMGYPIKRGRGRPRRNPLPGTLPGPIPAFIIPSPSGQAVMMAPVQNMTQLEALQRGQSLVNIKPKPIAPAPSIDMSTESPPIIIQNADGTQTQINQPSREVAPCVTETTTMIVDDEGNLHPMPADMMEGSTVTSLGAEDLEDNEAPLEDINDITDKEKNNEDQGDKSMPPAAIIQLPPNLVPLLLPKKEPVKIGLKATESELEKLRCPKCDFQAYYQQQYQDHIATHQDDIHKCKCCNFLTFNNDDLLSHFKEAHPKCICTECDFMAEHAYVIKRHLLRHKAHGCECEICGKRYKDQYILKMHIKMVHMPAEVLYGCNVCSKKFTRKAHLKRHLRIHDPEKPFKCVHCDYRGCERSDIKKHLLIHEEPKHVCEVCGKAFRHIKNKELHVKRHKGQRDYKCGVCDFYGYTFTDIRKHIERKHSDAKNILCDKCGSAFKNDTLLKEHQRHQCELLMIEQAFNEAGHDGSTTIQIPASQLGPDGQIMVDGNVNITVEQVALADDSVVSLEGHLRGGHLVDEDGNVIDASQVELASHMAVVEDSMGQVVEEDEEVLEEEELDMDENEHVQMVAMDDTGQMEQVELEEGELVTADDLVHHTQEITEDGLIIMATQ